MFVPGKFLFRRVPSLGLIRGRVQPLGRLAPVPPPDQVVPFRDQVPKWASLMAERDTTVHAPASLLLQLAVGEFGVDLAPVLDPDVHRAAGGYLPPRRHESLGISHDASPLSRAPRP